MEPSTTPVRTRYHAFEDFQVHEHTKGPARHAAAQLMRMYRIARDLPSPSILELGAGRGESTTVFLQACQERDGRLVSVDIKDCSDVSDSEQWTFVQADSTDVTTIIAKAPVLNEGIDILYVDSLHRRSHVEKELMGWYPLLAQGAHIFLDDVDSNPYRRGNRKDNVRAELAFDEIREYVQAFFYANEDELSLDITFGSTGLAHMHKVSPMGSVPTPARRLTHRRNSLTTILVDYPRLIERWRRRGGS
jgi:predicted O-methyltransferase YrrM